MAISAESITEKETPKKSFKVPLWAIWILVVILTFGSLFYFLFLQEPTFTETSVFVEEGGVLTKEDLDMLQKVIIAVNKPPIRSLEKGISESIFVSPPKSKIGGVKNPFAPTK